MMYEGIPNPVGRKCKLDSKISNMSVLATLIQSEGGMRNRLTNSLTSAH